MQPRPEPVRVLIVDDDPFELEGHRSLLAGVPSITVVAAVRHGDVTAALLDGIDVAIIDMWDRRGTGFDRYPGIEVARLLRARHPRLLVDAVRRGSWSDHVTAVAVSRHVENVVLGKRMQEAGVDLRFDRYEDAVDDPRRLADVVRAPDRYLAEHAGQAWRLTEAARELGMTPQTHVNDLLQAVADREPKALFATRRPYRDNSERHRWQAAMRTVVPAFGLTRPSDRSAGGSRPRGMSFEDLRAFLRKARGSSD